ncbi:glucose 1-dehydrogenase [Streptomyces sp. NPDC004549]|uniref:SDR family NAD(P)-dependent oxidoreductase n=1 Tax=Streptomyces sp. NPDC004549 TaxID=3154283 RepID=UPI0033B03C59
MGRRFEGKVVVVTGGGAGIGRASARGFAGEGARVVVAGPRGESIEETVGIIEGEGGVASAVVADVTRAEDMARLVRTTVERYGALHIAHNNAGIFGKPTPVGDLDPADWQHVLDVNLTGVLLAMREEVGHMRAHGGGVIVNTASNIGYHGRRPGMAAYAASKAAVSALTKVAALDHIGDGIRINAVSPGATDTTMSLRPGESDADRAARLATAVPAGRVASTQEIVNAVLWLASEESSFVVGHDLVVDGGVTA